MLDCQDRLRLPVDVVPMRDAHDVVVWIGAAHGSSASSVVTSLRSAAAFRARSEKSVLVSGHSGDLQARSRFEAYTW